MRRFIITGTPGAGKTAILRQLELDGFSVVEEAATAVIAADQARGIAEPWTDPCFIDAVVLLQNQRRVRASALPGDLQFHDRSPVCTAALARYLGYPYSPTLTEEIERLLAEGIFERRVFFVQNMGFTPASDARRIGFEEALRFESIHEEIYVGFGFELIPISPGSLLDRTRSIKSAVL